jgi:hypothetical protein
MTATVANPAAAPAVAFSHCHWSRLGGCVDIWEDLNLIVELV